jgi:hypothetical protein
MKFTGAQFRAWNQKAITLIGMSGVGKTSIARILRKRQWFHYSADYRIGTRYMGEAILDNIKFEAMQIDFLRNLLRSDSIHITNNITVDNLHPLSSFLGKVGNPELGGLGLREFKRRQQMHRLAEIAAMRDVPGFINKARAIYGYDHFVNDAGGSLCELDDDESIDSLARHTLIIYIKATGDDEQDLISRAEADPKPLYYREEFLDEQLALYMREHRLEYVALIDPDDFVRWVFPRLFRARIPRYEAIAEQYGYTITTKELAGIEVEEEFLDLVVRVLNRS